MSTTNLENVLKRYTDVPALLNMLHSKQITLLNPQSWEDRNDAHYLQVLKERKNLKSVLALCFSQSTETFHHWKVFAPGVSGVCVDFDRTVLLEALQGVPEVSFQRMNYLTLNQARHTAFSTEELPFIKRAGYRAEAEFRVLYQSHEQELQSLSLDIPTHAIRSVTLSPWLHDSLRDVLSRTLRGFEGFDRLKVLRSKLISSDEWKSFGTDAFDA